jgi:2-oxo-4-hydroxy-4-carboxy-5-ureidoimidazoline decarboxylase
MLAARPFIDADDLLRRGREAWWTLSEADWLEAFAGHPKIGDMQSLRAKYGGDRAWSEKEQSGMDAASEAVISELAVLNTAYEAKFGFIFIVCATGKAAAEMLELIRERVARSRSEELAQAAAEQWKITKLRLEKLL